MEISRAKFRLVENGLYTECYIDVRKYRIYFECVTEYLRKHVEFAEIIFSRVENEIIFV